MSKHHAVGLFDSVDGHGGAERHQRRKEWEERSFERDGDRQRHARISERAIKAYGARDQEARRQIRELRAAY